MYPSLFSTSSTLARIFEPGVETLDLARICALRMRVMRSLIGSCVDMRPSLPARLHETRDQAPGTEVTDRDAAHLGLAIDRVRPAADLAAVVNARCRRNARHFGKLDGRGEALFHRLLLVRDDRFQPRTLGRSILRHLLTPVILLDRTFLSHSIVSIPFRV